ncbi:MAG TPA: thiamine pyrophosphate-dependent enzyme [Gaiellaceae bacterium]
MTATGVERQSALGWEILADALRDASLDLILAVAGRPITPVGEALVATGDARWINHEAPAMAMALAASGLGKRTAVLVKQVGLNAGLDVLACAAPHRSGGAMVVVVGDDPGGAYSQTEGDARRLAAAIDLPCIDAAGGSDLPAALHEALALSVRVQAPAILRVVSQTLLELRSSVLPEERPAVEARPFDPRFWRTDPEGQRRAIVQALEALPEDGAFTRRPGEGDLRVVAAGEPGAQVLASTELDVLLVRRAHPLPAGAIGAFVRESDAPLLVLEDSNPLLEDEVRAAATTRPVLGRRTSQVPWTGPIDVVASIEAARAGRALELAPPKYFPGDPKADLSPYGTLWDDCVALGLTPVGLDAGHCYAGVWLDGDPSPFMYGLGSGIAAAAGLALAQGRPVVCISGDMGVFHAGILGLLQVVRDQIPVVTFIADDGVARYTGGQPHPGSTAGPGQREVSLVDLARGAGVDLVETLDMDEMRSEIVRPLLQRLIDANRPAVVVIDARRVAQRGEE